MKRLTILLCLVLGLPVWAQEAVNFSQVSEVVRLEVQEIHTLADSGKLDEAILRLKELISRLPSELQSIQLQYDLANLLFLQGRYEEARVVYERVVFRSEDQKDLIERSKNRIRAMKERGSKKKDEVAIRLIEIESALEANQDPAEGSKVYLRQVARESIHYDSAQRLLGKLQEREEKQARELLNQARKLFDERKELESVVILLEEIQRKFPESDEIPSVKILMEETIRRLGKRSAYVPSSQEAR